MSHKIEKPQHKQTQRKRTNPVRRSRIPVTPSEASGSDETPVRRARSRRQVSKQTATSLADQQPSTLTETQTSLKSQITNGNRAVENHQSSVDNPLISSQETDKNEATNDLYHSGVSATATTTRKVQLPEEELRVQIFSQLKKLQETEDPEYFINKSANPYLLRQNEIPQVIAAIKRNDADWIDNFYEKLQEGSTKYKHDIFL